VTIRTRYARPLLLASLAATVAATALAQGQVYKSRDAQGNVIFSDTSSERASTVTVPPTNTIPVVAAPARPVAAPATGDAAGAGYALAITTPVEGQTVFSAVGALDVSLSVSPALQPGHSLRLLLDGAPADLPQQGSLTLEGLGPGPHTLQAQVVDGNGEIVQSSGTVTVQMQRSQGRRIGPTRIP
jgi:hypothetical protein